MRGFSTPSVGLQALVLGGEAGIGKSTLWLAGRQMALERRARSAAEELTRAGTRVSFEGSIHVPEDEICFFTFEASSSQEPP